MEVLKLVKQQQRIIRPKIFLAQYNISQQCYSLLQPVWLMSHASSGTQRPHAGLPACATTFSMIFGEADNQMTHSISTLNLCYCCDVTKSWA